MNPRIPDDILVRARECNAPRYVGWTLLPFAALNMGVSYDNAKSLVRRGWLELMGKYDEFWFVSQASVARYMRLAVKPTAREKGRWEGRNRMVLRRKEKIAPEAKERFDPAWEYLREVLGDPKQARLKNVVVFGYPAGLLVNAIRSTGVHPVSKYLDVKSKTLMATLKRLAGVTPRDCGIDDQKLPYSRARARLFKSAKGVKLVACKTAGMGRMATAEVLKCKPSHVDQLWQTAGWDVSDLQD